MSDIVGVSEARQRSAIYSEFALAFRYPQSVDPDEGGAELRSQYMACFDPAISKQARSLYESAYTDADRSTVFEELVRFYSYFGLGRAEDSELPDHLTVELEFMHFLTFLEHAASTRGEPTGDLRMAQRDFIERHLKKLVAAIREGMPDGGPFYEALLADLSEFLTAEEQLFVGRHKYGQPMQGTCNDCRQ